MKLLALLLKRQGILGALTVWAVLSASLLCAANAFASFRMYAVWYPYGYTNPPAVAQSGATIGGWFYVRAVVQPQSGNIISATITSSSLEEVTSAHTVTPSSPGYQQATPNPAYGDPTSNAIVLQIPATLWLNHNSTYRFRITVEYSTTNGRPVVPMSSPPHGSQTFRESAELLLNARNMELLVNEPSAYFVWDPASMTQKGFHVFLQHAQSGACTVILRIYDSSDNQNPVAVRVYNHFRPDDHTFVWDGMCDGNPPSRAERGIYLYEIEAIAGVQPSGLPDRDSNRSDTLRITSTALDFDYEEDEWIATCNVVGELSSGLVQVFAPLSLQVIVSGQGSAVSGGYRARLANFDADEGGSYVFLMRAWDRGDLDGTDKAHRRREALPLNQRVLKYPVALVGMPFSAGTLATVWNNLKKCPLLIAVCQIHNFGSFHQRANAALYLQIARGSRHCISSTTLPEDRPVDSLYTWSETISGVWVGVQGHMAVVFAIGAKTCGNTMRLPRGCCQSCSSCGHDSVREWG